MTMTSDDPTAPLRATSARHATDLAAERLAPTIDAASKSTGVRFDYLMAQAGKESAFESRAKSNASSAAGLYQFTKGTWLQLLKRHGHSLGLGTFADSIEKTAQGDYVVHDPARRQEILDLRRDAKTAALMAGEYAHDNRQWLEHSLGRHVDSAELYMAHFLGPSGAARILKANAETPDQSAAALLPQAAAKNAAFFYDTNHSPRSVAAVYSRIRQAIDGPIEHYAHYRPDGQAPIDSTKLAAVESLASPVSPSAPVAMTVTAKASESPQPTAVPAATSPTIVAESERPSADRIISPMPPVNGHLAGPSKSENPMAYWMKSLFG